MTGTCYSIWQFLFSHYDDCTSMNNTYSFLLVRSTPFITALQTLTIANLVKHFRRQWAFCLQGEYIYNNHGNRTGQLISPCASTVHYGDWVNTSSLSLMSVIYTNPHQNTCKQTRIFLNYGLIRSNTAPVHTLPI